MPPPTTQTSADTDSASGGWVVCGAVSIHTDVGRPGSDWDMP
jgi:hypothetical protein